MGASLERSGLVRELGPGSWAIGAGGSASLSPEGRLTLVADDDVAADALLAVAAARARELGLTQLEVRPALEEPVATGLLERHDFRLRSEVLAMRRPLGAAEPEPRWPEGVAVRTFEPSDALRVHALLDEAYRGWDPSYVPIDHEDWVRAMTGDAEFDPGVWWLAERDGDLVGCALWWTSGWLKDLVVHVDERGRGLGAALVRRGFSEFARRGAGSVGLKVDASNPTGAPQLYERLGFEVEHREQVWARSL
jgi:ribosomal protein S18 acetylase RimI-like enzyme